MAWNLKHFFFQKKKRGGGINSICELCFQVEYVCCILPETNNFIPRASKLTFFKPGMLEPKKV